MEALGRRARGLAGAGARLELPVGHAVGVGLEHDGRLVERELADLDLAAQQRPPRRRGADPAHVEHLGARRRPAALAKCTRWALTRGTGSILSCIGPSITSSRPVASFTAWIRAGL